MADMDSVKAYYASLLTQVEGRCKEPEPDYCRWPNVEVPDYCQLCIGDFPKGTLVPTPINGRVLALCGNCRESLGLGKES